MLRDALIVLGTLALCGVLLGITAALSGCTIQEITLYKTIVTQPTPQAVTPHARIGPS